MLHDTIVRGMRAFRVVTRRGGARLQIPTSDAHVSAQQQA